MAKPIKNALRKAAQSEISRKHFDRFDLGAFLFITAAFTVLCILVTAYTAWSFRSITWMSAFRAWGLGAVLQTVWMIVHLISDAEEIDSGYRRQLLTIAAILCAPIILGLGAWLLS